MKKPVVSVLMPAYNTNETYLRDAVKSILNQTFKDFELLILDDSSKPNNIESILKSFKDDRIKYSKNPKNLGISLTRNKLIDMAKGKYLAVMDHDDISMPTRFEEQVKFLDEHSDYGVVSGWFERFPKKKIFKKPTNDDEIKSTLMKHCSILHPCSMIRKDVLVETNIRYENEFTPAEDYALWCRLIPFTKFYNIPKVLLKYRCHETNATKFMETQMINATHKIHEFVKEQNPELYEERMKNEKKRYVFKLFGIIPFMSIDISINITKVRLLGVLVVSIKRKMGLVL